MKTQNVKSRTYFPRLDETLTNDSAIEEVTNEILLWLADQAEKKGDIKNAERLRNEANNTSIT
jgi:hypothetical protein